MFTKSFVLDALERAGKTFLQILLVALGFDHVTSAVHMSVSQALILAGAAAVVSLLTSVVSAGVGSTGTAPLTDAVVANPAP